MLQYFYIEYGVMIALLLLILAITRRDLPSYAISAWDLRFHLVIARASFVPAADRNG